MPCSGAALLLYWFEWNHVVWFSQSHISWSTGNKMAVPIPCGMVQPIVAVVLKMIKKDGGTHEATSWLSFLQTLKEYEIITLIYNRKSCKLDLLSNLCTRGYNYLVDPTRQHNVWRKTRQGEGKLVARKDCGKFIPTKSAAVRLFIQYTN